MLDDVARTVGILRGSGDVLGLVAVSDRLEAQALTSPEDLTARAAASVARAALDCANIDDKAAWAALDLARHALKIAIDTTTACR